jgi:hypothetical protein
MNEIIDITDKEKIRGEITQKYLEYYYTNDANTPNHVQLEELRNLIQKYPAFLWEDTANLTNRIIKDYIEAYGYNMTRRAILEETIMSIKTQLNYEASTIIEKMVIDSIAVSWLQWHHIETTFTESLYQQGFDEKEKKFWDQLLNSAQKRYLRAIDSLTKIRKTGVNLQINIAQNVGTQKVQQKVK